MSYRFVDSIAECTANKTPWWTEELSETCRVSCQNKFVKLVHLVVFITKKTHYVDNCYIYHVRTNKTFNRWGWKFFCSRVGTQNREAIWFPVLGQNTRVWLAPVGFKSTSPTARSPHPTIARRHLRLKHQRDYDLIHRQIITPGLRRIPCLDRTRELETILLNRAISTNCTESQKQLDVVKNCSSPI
jgi:hypothetical protein